MNVISLEYHETLMAGSGLEAQGALADAVKKYSGKYICVVEGAMPTRDKGVYMKLAGQPAMEVLADLGGKAAAIVAIGSCAAWDAFRRPIPIQQARGRRCRSATQSDDCRSAGCPPNPYTLLVGSSHNSDSSRAVPWGFFQRLQVMLKTAP